MFINKIALLFLFIPSLAFSQTKKKVDTIFVHEKVFVYKKKPNTATIKWIGFDSIYKIKFRAVKEFPVTITADTSLLKPMALSTAKGKKKLFAIDNYGVSIQSVYSQQSEIKSYGGGIGLFVTKNIYKNRLFLELEFLFSKIFSITDTKSIDGYYITPNAVLYYQAENMTTQQLSLPLSLFWKYKKIKPQIGVAFIQKQTKLDFASYKNNTDLTSPLRESFKITNHYLDVIYGIEYEINKRIGVSLRSKQTLVKISGNGVSENLKQLEELHFFPNQVLLGFTYNLKRQ